MVGRGAIKHALRWVGAAVRRNTMDLWRRVGEPQRLNVGLGEGLIGAGVAWVR